MEKEGRVENGGCRNCPAQPLSHNHYCRDCFVSRFRHKFRALLGSSRLLKWGERIVIGCSGSLASVTLLHLIQQGLSETTHKRLKVDPLLVYIDENVVRGDKDCERRTELLNSLLTYGYPAYCVPLEMVCRDSQFILSEVTSETIPSLPFNSNTDTSIALRQVLFSVKTATAKRDLQRKLRMRLLVECCRQLSATKLLVPAIADTLAVDVLSGVALGGGRAVPSLTGFRDERYVDVSVLRPLRDVTLPEMECYAQLFDLRPFAPTTLGATQQGHESSIQCLTEELVASLQSNLSHTVPTILRTVDKCNKTKTEGAQSLCILCWAYFLNDEERSTVCYSCKLILTDSSNPDDLKSCLCTAKS